MLFISFNQGLCWYQTLFLWIWVINRAILTLIHNVFILNINVLARNLRSVLGICRLWIIVIACTHYESASQLLISLIRLASEIESWCWNDIIIIWIIKTLRISIWWWMHDCKWLILFHAHYWWLLLQRLLWSQWFSSGECHISWFLTQKANVGFLESHYSSATCLSFHLNSI